MTRTIWTAIAVIGSYSAPALAEDVHDFPEKISLTDELYVSSLEDYREPITIASILRACDRPGIASKVQPDYSSLVQPILAKLTEMWPDGSNDAKLKIVDDVILILKGFSQGYEASVEMMAADTQGESPHYICNSAIYFADAYLASLEQAAE